MKSTLKIQLRIFYTNLPAVATFGGGKAEDEFLIKDSM
jgi:hypothetical protein